jgi:uncharacterized membrane protein
MTDTLVAAALWALALGSGLIAGALFVFSAFVLAAFDTLPRPAGIAAMQAINRVILRSAFMPVFFGTAVAGLALAVAAALGAAGPGAAAAGGLYLIGVVAVTAAANVPLNNRLDAADPETAEGAATWAEYRRVWTRWNHLRVAAALAATALAITALTAG